MNVDAASQPSAVRSKNRAAKVGDVSIPGVQHAEVKVSPAVRIALTSLY